MTNLSMPAFAPPRDAAPPAIRVGDVFSRSRKTFAAHWLAYCGTLMLGYAPTLVAAVVVTLGVSLTRGVAVSFARVAQDHWGIAVVIGIVFGIAAFASLLLAYAAISFGAAQDIGGRGFSFGQSLRAAMRRSLAIVGLTLLIGLLGMFALIFLIVPGLIVFCVYSVAFPACVIEGLGPIKSMSRSAFLTKGNRWRIFGILCLLYVGSIVLEQLIKFLATHIAGAMTGLVISLLFDVAVGAFGAVAIGVLYIQLRVAREGVDIEHIAKVFD
jgi:uncharacterized membrane protein